MQKPALLFLLILSFTNLSCGEEDRPNSDGAGASQASGDGGANDRGGADGIGGVDGTGSAGPSGGEAGAGGTPLDSREVPDVGEPGFDPSRDPGVHPAFIDDPDLTRDEDHVYAPTQAGDHDLAEGVFAINYDVTGVAEKCRGRSDFIARVRLEGAFHGV